MFCYQPINLLQQSEHVRAISHLLLQGGPKGYVYILFDCDKSVRELLKQCTHDYSNGGEYYYKMSSRRMRCKEVQVTR